MSTNPNERGLRLEKCLRSFKLKSNTVQISLFAILDTGRRISLFKAKFAVPNCYCPIQGTSTNYYGVLGQDFK